MMMFKRIFGRAELTEREANTLLGMLKLLRWQLNNHKDQVNQLKQADESPSSISWLPGQDRS
jgi:tRNA C32,U32 (ribose-2'-O)-methylase TrmJ